MLEASIFTGCVPRMLRLQSWLRRWTDPLRSRWLQRQRPRRTRPDQAPRLEVHLRLDDPYSYLLVQMLPQLDELLDPALQPLPVIIHTTPPAHWPGGLSARQWQQYALTDTVTLAQQHRFIPPPDAAPDPALVSMAGELLQRATLPEEDLLHLLENVFHMVWQNQRTKLETVHQLALSRPAHDASRVSWSAVPLVWATLDYRDRTYRGIDDFLRLTRRLKRERLLTSEPVFLIDHVEWGEHLVSDPMLLADIQAMQPVLTFYGALEDPFTYLLLAYLEQHMAGYYNLTLYFRPLPYQQRDQFDWKLAMRVAARTEVPFAPFCRPDALAAEQMAAALAQLPPEQQVSSLLGWLRAVWHEGQDAGFAPHWQRMTAALPPALMQAAGTPQALDTARQQMQQNQQQIDALGLPEQPVMELAVGDAVYRFVGLYRVWQVEVRLAATRLPDTDADIPPVDPARG